MKDTLSYGVVGTLSSFIGFFTTPIFTRFLSPTDYGILDTTNLILVILSLFGSLQLETSLLRFYFDDKSFKHKQSIYTTGLFILIPLSTIIVILFIIFGKEISKLLFNSQDYSLIIFIAIFKLPFDNIRGYNNSLFRAEQNRKRFLWFNTLYIIIASTFSVFFISILKAGVVGILYSQTITSILFSLISSWLTRKYIDYNSFSLLRLWEMLKYGLPFIPSSLSYYAQLYINRVFILSFFTMHSVGIYAIAVKLVLPITLLNNTLKQAWLPKALDSYKHEKSKYNFNSFLFLYLTLSIIFSLILTFMGEQLVIVFATSKYIEAGQLIGLLSIIALINGLINLISVGIHIVKRTYLLVYGTLINLLFSSLGMLYFSKIVALQGIVIGSLVGVVFNLLVISIVINKYFKGYFHFIKMYIILACCSAIIIFKSLNLI